MDRCGLGGGGGGISNCYPTHDAQLYIVGELSGEEGPWSDGVQVPIAFLLF